MFHSSSEADLFKLLLQADHLADQENSIPYLWDPQSLETETYLQSIEQDWPEDIVADYETIAPSLNKALNITPTDLLLDRFSGIPESIVHHILTHVKFTGLELLSISEQLLYCVQDLFPGWAIEDLQVLARPYAYAFRSGSGVTPASPQTPPHSIEAIEWSKLSDLEQIRLCFQISKAALEQEQA